MTELTVDNHAVSNRTTKIVASILSWVMILTSMVLACYGLTWVVKDKFSKIQPITGTEITAKVRERQLDCLAQNIYYEAGSEPFEGKVAVAQVTLNRSESNQFPNDICKVVYQKNVVYDKILCQFSWYCEGKPGIKPKNNIAYEQSMEAAKKVLMEGFRLPSLDNALYYHADYVNPKWNKIQVAKIGRHIFYN